MSPVRCCLCSAWTDDDLDKDMSTILCRTCAAAESAENEEYVR